MENSCSGIWWLAVIDVLASEWLKEKTLHFQLPSVAQERLCLTPLPPPHPLCLGKQIILGEYDFHHHPHQEFGVVRKGEFNPSSK